MAKVTYVTVAEKYTNILRCFCPKAKQFAKKANSPYLLTQLHLRILMSTSKGTPCLNEVFEIKNELGKLHTPTCK